MLSVLSVEVKLEENCSVDKYGASGLIYTDTHSRTMLVIVHRIHKEFFQLLNNETF